MQIYSMEEEQKQNQLLRLFNSNYRYFYLLYFAGVFFIKKLQNPSVTLCAKSDVIGHTWAPQPMTRGRGRGARSAPPSPGPVFWTGLNRFEQWVETWEKLQRNSQYDAFLRWIFATKLQRHRGKVFLRRPVSQKRAQSSIYTWNPLKNTAAWAAVIHPDTLTQTSEDGDVSSQCHRLQLCQHSHKKRL